MSNWQSRHPEEGLLLRYLDGELSPWKARQVRRHLEACWQCRAEVEALEDTVADCMRYRKQVLETCLPEPPAAWGNLQRGFDQIDAEAQTQPFWKNLLRMPRPFQWSVAALAMAAAVFAIVYQLRETPSVQAAALLKNAVAAAEARPVRVHRIQIRTRSAQMVRTVGVTRASAEPMPAAMDALFAAAHYDGADPLSARTFEAWRNSIPEKQDQVATVADPQASGNSCYQIQTKAASGEVAVATLTLRTADLHPVEGKLEFRDQDWIEFTEVSEAPHTTDDSAVRISREFPVQPAEPSRPAATSPRETASISDELQVLSALHQIGADLGDPVEVKRDNGRVLVSGVGIAPVRQRQIHSALDGIPHVAVEFAEPGTVPAPPETAAPETAPATAPNPRIQARLEQQLGGRAEFERFSSRMLDWNESAMAHAYALRSLAERFPAAGEAGMSVKDRAVLHDLVRQHVIALAGQAAGMEGVLTPILTSLGGSQGASQRSSDAAAWQPVAMDVFRTCRREEVLLSQLLGVTAGDRSPAEVPGQLLASLRDLRADLDRCRKLLEPLP